MKKNSNLGQLYQNMQEAYNEMQTPLAFQMPPTLVHVSKFISNYTFPLLFHDLITLEFQIGTERAERFHHPTSVEYRLH